MYECLSCGNRFDEPARHRERSEFWGYPAYETVSGCPRCGGGYIELTEIKEDWDDEVD